MGSNDGTGCFVIVVVLGAALLCGVCSSSSYHKGVAYGEQQMREAAVVKGKAKWVVQIDGTTVFEWLGAEGL